MTDVVDQTIPRSRSIAAAYQRGYDARLGKQSAYSNPYGDPIERAQAEGRPAGWAWAFFSAWLLGWKLADSQLEELR